VPLKYITRILKPVLGGFYLLVFFEAFYMVSFFGIYLATVYAPAEQFLDRHPATSWLLSFYLPHFYQSSLGPLNVGVYILIGIVIWFAGFWIFFYSALQIYGTRLTGGIAITHGFYRWIRHPQYLAFMAMPLPFLLIWPRYLLLGMYAALLVFYIALAFREERECLRLYGQSYREYQEATAMFFPIIRIERLLTALPVSLPGNTALRFLSISGMAVSGAVLACFLGILLTKAWTGSIPLVREPAGIWVPLQHEDRPILPEVKRIAETDGLLQKALSQLQGEGSQSCYVLVLPFNDKHFFLDYEGSLRPETPWTGISSEDYWVSHRLLEISPEDFRSLIFFTSREPLPGKGSALFSIIQQAGRWRPEYMAGVDLRKGRVVSRVRLKKADYSSTSTMRLPLL